MSRVVCHIGDYKTGTTSLQLFLREHEHTLLRPHGYRYPIGWLRRDKVVELQLALMRTDRLSIVRARNDEWRSPAFRDELVFQVTDDLLQHPNETTIMSSELLAAFRYDDEIAALRNVIGDAVIIVYWRDPLDWLSAMKDQLVKNGFDPQTDDPDDFRYVGEDAWQLDHAGRTAQWRRHFTSVVALNYDRAVIEDGSVIPSFFRQLLLDEPDDIDQPRYWINRRGESDREWLFNGNRASGLPFGARPPG